MPPQALLHHAVDIADAATEAPVAAAIASLPAGGLLLLRLTSSNSYDKPSTPRAMPRAAAAVARLAKGARQAGAAIALDPREGSWMRRIEDAVRVAMRVNRGNVGVALSIADWFATDGDEAMLPQRLKLALPNLLMVTAAGDAAQTERVMKLLKAMGYVGA